MRQNMVLALSIALIALAACSREPANEAQPSDNDMIAEDNEANTTAPHSNMSANSDFGNNMGASSNSGKLPMNAIPAALRGRWGMVKNDCTSTHGDAKGLLEISSGKLTFYESRGTLGKVSEIEPTRIRAMYNFEGEGQTWQRDMILEVQDGGQSLIRMEYSDATTPESYHYSRCAS
jgi:hypothetical protein